MLNFSEIKIVIFIELELIKQKNTSKNSEVLDLTIKFRKSDIEYKRIGIQIP